MKVWTWINRSMKRKWFVLLVLFNAVIICVYGLVTYIQTSSGVKQYTEQFGERVLIQANLNMHRYLHNYTESLLLLASSPEIGEWLPLLPEDRTENFSLKRRIEKNFKSMFFYHYPEISSILLSNDNGNRLVFSNYYEIKSERFTHYRPMFRASSREVNVLYSSGAPDYYLDKGEPASISVIHIRNRVQRNGQAGWVQMDLDMSPALQILQNAGLGQHGEAMIVDDNFHIVAHQDAGRLGEQISEQLSSNMSLAEGSFVLKDKQLIVLYASLDPIPWRTIVIVPYNEFLPLTSQLASAAIWTAGLSVLLAVILANLFSNTFIRRIHRLRKAITNMEYGQSKKRILLSGSDEIYELGVAYNRMIERLDLTVNQLSEIKTKEKQATISALQSQIDSHFLYNTLENINSKAFLAGQRDIEVIALSLSEMLRYSSNYGDAIVPIYKELEHLGYYNDIIRIRFEGYVDIQISVDERCKQALCLRTIMQPIAENCVKHGFPEDDSNLTIMIKVEVVDVHYVRITVEDNGSGFNPDKLKELKRRLKQIAPFTDSFPRVGLLNVHSRLRTIYPDHPQCGVYVDNRAGTRGACVRLIFPLHYTTEIELVRRPVLSGEERI